MQTAIKLGIYRVEFDIQATHDGELIIFHDDFIHDQGSRKSIATLTRAELLEIARKGPDEIPTLDDVLGSCRDRIKIQAELKSDGTEAQACSCIKKANFPLCDINISSFSIDRLARVRSLASALEDVQMVLLLGKKLPVTLALDEMEAIGISSISIFASVVTTGLVDKVHERGFRIIAWGLGEKGLQVDKINTRYRLLLNKSVDGFTCAYPDKLQQMIRGASR